MDPQHWPPKPLSRILLQKVDILGYIALNKVLDYFRQYTCLLILDCSMFGG